MLVAMSVFRIPQVLLEVLLDRYRRDFNVTIGNFTLIHIHKTRCGCNKSFITYPNQDELMGNGSLKTDTSAIAA